MRVLDGVFDARQGAFIGGRNLLDGVVVAGWE